MSIQPITGLAGEFESVLISSLVEILSIGKWAEVSRLCFRTCLAHFAASFGFSRRVRLVCGLCNRRGIRRHAQCGTVPIPLRRSSDFRVFAFVDVLWAVDRVRCVGLGHRKAQSMCDRIDHRGCCFSSLDHQYLASIWQQRGMQFKVRCVLSVIHIQHHDTFCRSDHVSYFAQTLNQRTILDWEFAGCQLCILGRGSPTLMISVSSADKTSSRWRTVSSSPKYFAIRTYVV